jgi:hypothetical protein
MSTGELTWFKSSYSSASGDDCVEIATRPGAVHVRDSKDRNGARLTVSPGAWVDFLTRVCG